ncbi:hypothetical protein [Pseudocolwellia sp. HL-MZ7]|uniref:hypothetical protein n=1 Tax=Pseudocolwellia sp. HL-MZ7 TaxID=3400627 RepID=UPI003CE7F97F
MKPPKKLVEGLQKKGLLPESLPEITNFVEFEALLVEQISTKHDKLDCIVMFDGECIESENSYFFLMDEFISSIGEKHGISKLESKFDVNQGRIFCRAEKDSIEHEVNFEQESDWVSSEFIDFIFLLTTVKKGKFIEVSTGDQIFLAIFLNKTLSTAYEKYKSSDKNSREAFLNHYMFPEVKILSSLRYREVLSAFKSLFLESDKILDPEAYKKDTAIAALAISENKDALPIYHMVTQSPIKTHNYVTMNIYDYSIICPEGDCFFLSLKEPEKEVIFNYQAKNVGMLVGEHSEDLGDYIIIGKNLDWGIVVTGDMFICAGSPVLDLLTPIKKSIKGNLIAPIFKGFIENHYLPLICELGYKKTSVPNFSASAKEYELHWSTVSVLGEQESGTDNITIKIHLSVYNPEVQSFFKDNKTPPTLFDFTNYRGSTWQINSPDEFQDKIQDMCSYIKGIDAEGKKKIPLEKWVSLYVGCNQTFNSAIAAMLNNDKAEATRLVKIQIEKERAYPCGLSQDSKTIKLSELIDSMS